MQKYLLCVALCFVGAWAVADGSQDATAAPAPAPSPAVPTYDCEVIIVADDLPNGSADFRYTTDGKASATHLATASYPFEVQEYKISAISNARWFGIVWSKNGTPIARAMNVRSDDMTKPQAMMVYNPTNDDEEVSLDCSPSAP